MDKKLNAETQDKEAAPEVKEEALDQVNGGRKPAGGGMIAQLKRSR